MLLLLYFFSFLHCKTMVLLLTITAGFQTGTGVPEVVVLGNEVRGFPEIGVAGTLTVMRAFDVVAGPTELITAGLSHPEGVRMAG